MTVEFYTFCQAAEKEQSGQAAAMPLERALRMG
jgi:hypothetical protein